MKKQTHIFSLVILICIWLHSCVTETRTCDFQSNVALQWNQKILEIAITEDNLLTLKGVRTATMVHLAMHDALNSIVPKYDHFTYHQETTDANPLFAASYAAYTVAINQYPDKIEEFNKLLALYVLDKEEDEIKSKALGKAAAKAILENRKKDRWNGEEDYMLHPMAPGVYAEFNEHSGTPEGFVFGAGWAAAKPFALPKSDYYRVPPPPEIDSPEYTAAFNEVKEMGSYKSATRTSDQTHLAMWWKEFAESSHNALLRDLVQKEKLDLWEATRTFALLNMAIYDGYVNVFDNKFHYNHWRPYTAIRWAANDGNPDTEADEQWNNLHKHTYPFPSYPSAHGTVSTSAMTVLANALGKGDEYAFTMTQKEVDSAGFFSGKMKMNPPIRVFNSFSEAGLEAAMSRVYLGIHFRYDSEEGYRLGADIGHYVVTNFLKPKTN